MRYLVTGGLGVIGSLFARELLKLGHDVTVLDPGDSPRHELNLADIHKAWGEAGHGMLEVWNYATHEDPKGDCGAWRKQRFDRVIHAGASTGIPYSGEAPTEDWECNATGTLGLLEWLRAQKNPPPTIVLSSVKPYRVNGRQPLRGDEPLEPDEPYAASKAAQSCLAMAYGRTYDLPVLTFRCSNLWGPAACHGPRHGWLTWFCISAACGWPLELQGTGKQGRDMLWHTDLLDAVTRGHQALELGLVSPGDILTIGGGWRNITTVWDAASKLHTLTGCELVNAPDKGRKNEDEWVHVDNSAAHRALADVGGVIPQVGVDEGIKLMLQWATLHRNELEAVYA